MAMVYSHRPKLCDSYHDYDPYNLVKEASATQISESQQYLYSQEFNSEQSINGYDQKPGSLHVSNAQPAYDHHQTNVYQNSNSYQPNYEQITDLNYNYGQKLEIERGQQSKSHFDLTEYSQNPTLSNVSNSQEYNHDSNHEETTYDNPKPSLEDLAPALLKALEQYRNTIPRMRRNQISHSHQDITKDVSERFTAPNQSQSLTRSSHHSSQNQLDQHQAFDVQQMWTKALDHAYPFRKRLSSSAIHMPALYQMTTNSNSVNPNAFGGDQIWSKTNPQRKKRLDRQQVYNSSSSSQPNFSTSPNGSSSYDFFDASSTQQKHFDKQQALNQPVQMAGKQNSVRINGSSFQNYDPYNLQGKLLVPKKYDPYNLDSAQQTTTTTSSSSSTTTTAALPFQNDHSYEEMNDYSDDDDDDMYDEEERQQLLWEQEMYQQLKYKSPRRFFHTFEADHCQAGINFADEEESKRFEQVIGDKITERQRKKEDLIIQRRRQQNANRTQHVNMTRGDIGLNKISAAPPPPECNFISNTVSPMPKKFTTKKDKKNKSKLTKDDIGLPTDFRHVGHVGWDPQKGLDMDKVDEDMKKLFESVGYTSGENIDKDTVDFIYDFVEKYGGIDAVKKEMANRERNVTTRPTVPPPTPSRIGQPPLPPGRHMSPAPPPPSRAPPPSRGPAVPPPPPMRSTLPPPPKVPGAPPPPPPTNPPNSAHLPPRATTVESGGGAPPAPPPPPPPPPPPVMSDDKDDSAATQGTGTDARSALLDQIHRGTQLKKVTVTENRPPVEDKRDNLLSEIRNVGQKNLKKVDASQSARPTSAGEDGIVGALAQALANRMKSMQGSDGESDEESSDDDNTDDDDWDD